MSGIASEFVVPLLASFMRHPDWEVRSTAALCVGHLARIHHSFDRETLLPLLRNLQTDSRIARRIDDVFDDIQKYTKPPHPRRRARNLS